MSGGIVFLPSYYEAIRPLPDHERLALYDAILDYGITGAEPDSLSPLLAGYFALVRPNIDSSSKRYKSSVENGKKGGRPPKKPSENPAETKSKPAENLDKDKERDKEKDKEKDCEGVRKADKPPAPAPAAKPKRKNYGRFGWVKLSDEEYSRLLNDLGESEVKRCIQYVDESAQSTGNKNKWRDWNLVIRKCNRDGWGLSNATPPTKNGGKGFQTSNPFLEMLQEVQG